MADQLRLDIAVVNGDAALRQLDALDAKVKTLPQSAQQGAAGVEAAARRQADAMERESARAAAAVDREARKAADAQIREITRANQASLKAFDDELARRERLAKAQAGGFLGSAGPVAGLASTIGRGAALGVGYEALGAIQAGLEGIGSAAVGMNNRLEQARIGFTTMLGSAEKADAFLKDLAQFAATTPFEFPDLVTASQRMLAMGFAADQVRPLLTAVGNAAAALGSGKEGIDRITTALGQMQAKSKVQADEMRQLTEAGIPAWEILAKTLGVDVTQAMAQVEARTVSATTFINAFQVASKERYGDMMAQQSRTYAGAMSTIADNTQMAIAQGFKPLFAVLTETTVAIADFTQTDAWTNWATAVAGATGRVAEGIKAVPLAGRGAGDVANAVIGPELAAAGGAAGRGLGQVAQGAGVDAGELFLRGYALALGGPAAEVVVDAVKQLARRGQTDVAAEAQRIGGDYVQNVTAAIAASAPQGAEIAGAAIEGIVKDMTARGFSEDQAREVASLYWGQVARGLADKRPDLENAGLYMSQAVADGILAGQHLVGTAAQDLATTAGAILKASGGDLKKGLADALNVAGQTGFSANATASLVAEFEQQAHAAKSLEQVLGTLAPAQRAVYDITVQQAGPMAALTALVKDGVITQEQYTAMLQGGALAQRTLTEAQTRATEAALGGAVAVRAHAEALQQQHEQALGGALAIRDHEEALARQKEAALGGALAIRQHTEALAREKEADLGGALAIRQHAEDLAREKEAALGGALAIRTHSEDLAREKEAALGGALAIRDHEEALDREKTAALGGSLAIQQHVAAVELDRRAELLASGAAAARIDNLVGEAAATREYTAMLARLNDGQKSYFEAVKQVLGIEEALRQAREAAAHAPGPGFVGTGGTGAMTTFGSIGAGMASGMAGGLTAGQGTVGAAASALATSAVTAAQGALGISSPSKVAAQQIGLPLAQGIAAGMTSAQADAAIGAATRALASKGLDAARQAVKDAVPGGVGALMAQNAAAIAGGGYGGSEGSVPAFGADPGRTWAQLRAAGARGTSGSTDQGVDVLGSLLGSARTSIPIGADPLMQGLKQVQEALGGIGQAAGQAGATMVQAGGVMVRALSQPITVATGVVDALQSIEYTAIEATTRVQQAQAAALRANETLVAGLNLGKGLTYGQISGQTATQGTGTTGLVGTLGTPGAVQNLLPGNYYGVPVTGPITAGTLRGYADGGPVNEPTILVSRMTGRAYAQAGENGPEWVGPRGGGGGTTVNINLAVNGMDAIRDVRLWERALDEGLGKALRNRPGLVRA